MSRLIFADVDGTLINSKLQVTPKTKEAIRKQVLAGNVFVPVSGRMPQAIMTAAGQIMQKCPLIAYNGALVLDEVGQVLHTQFLPIDTAIEICHYVEAKNNESVWDIYSGNDWYCAEHKSKLTEMEEQVVGLKATPAKISDLQQLKGAHKMLIMGYPKDLDEMQAELTAKYPNLFLVKSDSYLLEVVVKGVSKGNGIKVMADAFNVDLKDCIAFGDNFNDEAMLEVVGHPVLMGNAPAALKEKFTTVTLDNDHDGIAAALTKFN